jgi:hypothetical protein
MTAAAAPEPSAGRMSFADRISGGPVWSGFIIGFAVWIFLEIVLVAAGYTGIRAGAGTTVRTSDWWWSLGAGVVALFIGGLISGLASRWHTIGAGALQGLTVWALTSVAVLVLASVGAGLGFGAISDAVGIKNAGLSGTAVPASTIQTARDAAGVSIALLAAVAAASVLGGILGAFLSGRVAGRKDARARLATTTR